MGYLATGYGTANLAEDINTLPREVISVFCGEFEIYDVEDGGRSIVFGSDGNYYTDCVEEAFSLISKFTESGTIEFCDDTGNHWRYVFDDEKHSWVYEDGVVVYQGEDRFVWIVLKITRQNEYTEPRYYEQARDATEICGVFDNERAAMLLLESLSNEESNSAALYDINESVFELKKERVEHDW